jgi:hypothetical protein
VSGPPCECGAGGAEWRGGALRLYLCSKCWRRRLESAGWTVHAIGAKCAACGLQVGKRDGVIRCGCPATVPPGAGK